VAELYERGIIIALINLHQLLQFIIWR